jgi:hypothetical protein
MSGGGIPEMQVVGTGLATAYRIAKAVVNADRAIDKAELRLQMADLMAALSESRQEALTARETIQALEARVRQLESNATLLASLKHKAPFYLADDDPIPYCARCVEVERLPVHVVKTTVIHEGRRLWACPKCQTNYADMNNVLHG